MAAIDRFVELISSPPPRLEELFRAGSRPDCEALAGWEWRGYNVPWFTKLLGIQKFIKGFFKSERGVEGYNIPVRQNGLAGDWLHRPDAANPKRFGFYRVAPVDPASPDNFYPDSVLLDYGASPRNAFYRVERLLRDYVAQPFADEPDVLLGKAYLALGSLRVPSNFFALKRLRRTPWRP